MRAMTVRQPWAWAIFNGKNVENRTANIAGTYRGPVAIHAGLQRDPSAWQHPALSNAFHQSITRARTVGELSDAMQRAIEQLGTGEFIGVVDLIDSHPCANGCCQPWGEHEYVDVRRLCDLEPTVHSAIQHLVLANPRPLPEPIPARGQLGLWTPPLEVIEEINEQLWRAA